MLAEIYNVETLLIKRMGRLPDNLVDQLVQLLQQALALLWADLNRVQQCEVPLISVQMETSAPGHSLSLWPGCVQKCPPTTKRVRREEELQEWKDQGAKVAAISCSAKQHKHSQRLQALYCRLGSKVVKTSCSQHAANVASSFSRTCKTFGVEVSRGRGKCAVAGTHTVSHRRLTCSLAP